MIFVWLYTLGSVVCVSLVSLIGAATISLNTKKLRQVLFVLVSFAAGALLGDVFIHLLPELLEESSLTLHTSLTILGGILLLLIIEKFIHWHHCHGPVEEQDGHVHPFAIMNLIGDGLHNFIDGTIIAASYLVSI